MLSIEEPPILKNLGVKPSPPFSRFAVADCHMMAMVKEARTIYFAMSFLV
jgi:hypothetical protein